MQSWFKEHEVNKPQEVNKELTPWEKLGVFVVAGGLSIFTAPFVLAFTTFMRGLVLFIGYLLLRPWLEQLVVGMPELGFLHAWGLAIIVTFIGDAFKDND